MIVIRALVALIVAFSHDVVVQGEIEPVCEGGVPFRDDFIPGPHNSDDFCGERIKAKDGVVTLQEHVDCDTNRLVYVKGGTLDCAGYTVRGGSDGGQDGTINVSDGGIVKNCRIEGNDDGSVSGINIGNGNNEVSNCLVDGGRDENIANGFSVNKRRGDSDLTCCKAQGVRHSGFDLFTQSGQTEVYDSIAENCGFRGFELRGNGRAILDGITVIHNGGDDEEAILINRKNNELTNVDIQVTGGANGIRFRGASDTTDNTVTGTAVVEEPGECAVGLIHRNDISGLRCN